PPQTASTVDDAIVRDCVRGVDVYRAVFLTVAIERRKEVGRTASSQITCSAPTHTSAFVSLEKRQSTGVALISPDK
ncbi:Hypothetical predicted protein, partial [Olea europaea subsp. europaea]